MNNLFFVIGLHPRSHHKYIFLDSESREEFISGVKICAKPTFKELENNCFLVFVIEIRWVGGEWVSAWRVVCEWTVSSRVRSECGMSTCWVFAACVSVWLVRDYMLSVRVWSVCDCMRSEWESGCAVVSAWLWGERSEDTWVHSEEVMSEWWLSNRVVSAWCVW